jgi:hypothetical protein
MLDFLEKMKPTSGSGGLSWNNQPRDRNGRWTNAGRGTGAPGALSSSRAAAGRTSATGSSGSAGGGINWHTSPKVARGMGAGNFREFNVDAYKPSQVEKFTHAQARNSYDSLMQTSRARFDSHPMTSGAGSGHNDSKNKRLLQGFENHHAWPKSMGGTDHSSNMVWLTPSEHVLAHHLFSVMLRKEPKTYAQYDKSGNAQKKLIALDKGWASKNLNKSYSDHGKRIDKAGNRTNVIARSFEYREVKDRADRTESRTQGYQEAYPSSKVVTGSFQNNSKLSSDAAASKFVEMSDQTRKHRPDVQAPVNDTWSLNSRSFGLQWSVGVMLPPADRKKWDAYYNSTVKPKATLAGLKEFERQNKKYNDDINAITQRTFKPTKPGSKTRTAESKAQMEREISRYRESNPKPSRQDLVNGAWLKADGNSTYTYEESARQHHLASVVAKAWTKDQAYINKKLNSYMGPSKNYKDAGKFVEQAQGHVKKNFQSKFRYATLKTIPKKGRVVVWSQYTGQSVSSTGKVTDGKPTLSPDGALSASVKAFILKHSK